MAMNCGIRQKGNVTILDLRGRLTLREALAFGLKGDMMLGDAVRELARKGQKKILLNLASVSDIDSSGIGQLIGALTTARNEGVDLKLMSPIIQVRSLLNLTKLDTVFDIKDDEAAAIESFSKDAAAGA